MHDRITSKGMWKFLEITHNISETVQDKDIVPMEDQQEIVCGFIDWQQYQ